MTNAYWNPPITEPSAYNKHVTESSNVNLFKIDFRLQVISKFTKHVLFEYFCVQASELKINLVWKYTANDRPPGVLNLF